MGFMEAVTSSRSCSGTALDKGHQKSKHPLLLVASLLRVAMPGATSRNLRTILCLSDGIPVVVFQSLPTELRQKHQQPINVIHNHVPRKFQTYRRLCWAPPTPLPPPRATTTLLLSCLVLSFLFLPFLFSFYVLFCSVLSVLSFCFSVCLSFCLSFCIFLFGVLSSFCLSAFFLSFCSSLPPSLTPFVRSFVRLFARSLVP